MQDPLRAPALPPRLRTGNFPDPQPPRSSVTSIVPQSSVLVLGWRFRHSELGEGGRTSILDALAGVAAQRHRILPANRNEKQSVPQLPALHQESQYQAASAEPQEAHTDELQEACRSFTSRPDFSHKTKFL